MSNLSIPVGSLVQLLPSKRVTRFMEMPYTTKFITAAWVDAIGEVVYKLNGQEGGYEASDFTVLEPPSPEHLRSAAAFSTDEDFDF